MSNLHTCPDCGHLHERQEQVAESTGKTRLSKPRKLTAKRKDGYWRVYIGRTALDVVIVQPIYAVNLRLRPTENEVRRAVREHAPQFAIADNTPVDYKD